MRKLILVLCLLCGQAIASPLADVCFTPPSGCENRLVELLNKAHVIKMQQYEFTSKPILAALLSAQGRGAVIEVILDKVPINVNNMKVLVASGIPVWIDSKHTIAHNKIIILNNKMLVGGSYNMTYSANHRNAENMVIMTSKQLAAKYALNFELHKSHSIKQEPTK